MRKNAQSELTENKNVTAKIQKFRRTQKLFTTWLQFMATLQSLIIPPRVNLY